VQKHLIQFTILIAAGAVALLPSVAGANVYRQGSIFHAAPAPHFMPRFQAPRVFQAPRLTRPLLRTHQPRLTTPLLRPHPGGRYVMAPHAMRHQHPLVYGRHGWYAPRNRSAFTLIPALVPGESPVDTETFLASIDVGSPLEPVGGCSTAPCLWAAMSMANDGAWGTAWTYNNADTARAAAIESCTSRASEPCAGIFMAVGTAWIAGLHCQKYDATGTYWRWSVMAPGNDLRAAIRNGYRTVAMNGFYNVNECDFVGAVAANGAQIQFVAQS